MPAVERCPHLALAVPGRDFVRSCVDLSQALDLWQTLCQRRCQHQREDFTWLETAFSKQFLQHLHWFGGLEYEWRNGERPEQAGFWVVLWSKDPKRLWWELREELDRQVVRPAEREDSSPWLIWLAPK
jgi:hypothetical protein